MLGTRTLGEILADREKIASEMQVNEFLSVMIIFGNEGERVF